jgi:hypothetical protein
MSIKATKEERLIVQVIELQNLLSSTVFYRDEFYKLAAKMHDELCLHHAYSFDNSMIQQFRLLEISAERVNQLPAEDTPT